MTQITEGDEELCQDDICGSAEPNIITQVIMEVKINLGIDVTVRKCRNNESDKLKMTFSKHFIKHFKNYSVQKNMCSRSETDWKIS